MSVPKAPSSIPVENRPHDADDPSAVTPRISGIVMAGYRDHLQRTLPNFAGQPA